MYGILDNNEVIAQFAAPMAVIDNTPSFGGDSLSLKRTVERRPAQRWEIETNLAPLSYDAQNLFAVLIVKGYGSKIDIRVPQNFGAKRARTATGSITATGSGSSSAISVQGVSGVIPRGTFIKFANHTKVYMLTADLNSSGVGSVYPVLRQSVTGAVSYQDDVNGEFYADLDNVRGMSYIDGILMDLGRLRFVEAV